MRDWVVEEVVTGAAGGAEFGVGAGDDVPEVGFGFFAGFEDWVEFHFFVNSCL